MASKSALQNIQGFHAVTPKKDCPHCTDENILPKDEFTGIHVNDTCPDCQHAGENWVCLKPGCRTVRCSRYVQSHMVSHNMANNDHPICFFFADFSFWCYLCESYIEHPLLDHTKFFYLQKFAEDDGQAQVFQKMKDSKHQEEIVEEDEDAEEQAAAASSTQAVPEEEKKSEEQPAEAGASEVDSLTKAMGGLSVKPEGSFSYEDLVAGLKEGKFRKILVLTGAGISVSAGIPDFRSPGTGLYDNLAEYNLPHPEAIFSIDYFVEKPEPFYRFAQHFDLTNCNATPTHYFVKMLQDKGMLWKNMTQNIDNLEEKAGMNMDSIIQCHGANRGAVCAKCRKSADQEALEQAIRDQNIMRCTSCNGPVKPNIVFFGESLPDEFFPALQNIESQVDLVLVMGTALAVAPFNLLPTMTKAGVPKVLFNMDNTKETGGIDFTELNSGKIFVQGKCDENIRQLAKDCGWTADFEAVLPDFHKTPAEQQ